MMHELHREAKRQHGLSLVELMISVTLGLVLLLGIVGVLSNSRQSTMVAIEQANLSESARFAVDNISRRIMQAGFQGCLSPDSNALQITAVDAPTNNVRTTAITGAVVKAAGVDWSPGVYTGFQPFAGFPPLAESHALMMQSASGQLHRLVDTQGGVSPDPTAPLHVEKGSGLVIGDLALITSCDYGDLFMVTDVADAVTHDVVAHTNPQNTSGRMLKAYGEPASRSVTWIGRFDSSIIYVAETGQTMADGYRLKALYIQSFPYTNANPPQRIISGVESMKTQFGVRTFDDRLIFVEPDSPQFDPASVEVVQFGILVASEEPVNDFDDNKTYYLAGLPVLPSEAENTGDFHPSDKRLRLAVNFTTKVRNRHFLTE